MPVSRLTTEGLAPQVSAVYGQAEVRLLQLMAKSLAAGVESPSWAEDKLRELQLFRRRADKVVRQATEQAVGAVQDVTVTAYLRGAAAGQGDVDMAGIRLDTPPRQAERAVEALVRAQAGTLEDVGLRVVRSTDDAYRQAVARAVGGGLSGAATRLQDAQVALDDLARRGVTGFVDTAGRRWGLEAYVDMATRTTTAQAAVAGHLDRLEDAGIQLVVVSNSSRECELCRPWEGKVLSRGPVDVLQTNVRTGTLERVAVDGTVQDAIRGGLMHPNCTHNLTGYVHGATTRGDADSNPGGYAEKQQQRHMERKVREWKRREAAAMTPEAQRKAQAKVRDWQARIRDHVDATGLPRKRNRESFDTRGPRTPAAPAIDQVPLERLDLELIEAEMADLMAANDYGPRFERLGAELDRRDQEAAAPPPVTLPDKPDPLAEQAALNRLLYGDSEVGDLTASRPRTAADREGELRDQYDAWVHTQWLRAEEECRGVMLSKAGERAFARGEFETIDLFTRKRTSLEFASEELQRWFAEPGNQRMSFPEFRAGIVDDKRAREANRRRQNRGYESEFG